MIIDIIKQNYIIKDEASLDIMIQTSDYEDEDVMKDILEMAEQFGYIKAKEELWV